MADDVNKQVSPVPLWVRILVLTLCSAVAGGSAVLVVAGSLSNLLTGLAMLGLAYLSWSQITMKLHLRHPENERARRKSLVLIALLLLAAAVVTGVAVWFLLQLY